MGSDSKGALQQGGTHPLDTTMESSSITSQLSNQDSKVNRDKRIAETENLLNKNIAELDKAYASTIDYILDCAKKQIKQELENKQQIKSNAEKAEDDFFAQEQYNAEQRNIELKNQELDDEQRKKFEAEELNRRIKELEQMIAFLNEQIKQEEERYQANINDFKENAVLFFNENVEQFLNEIITNEKHELYAHRHDLRQHIINHLKDDMLSKINKDYFPKNITSEINKEIVNAYRSFMKSHNLEHILHKFEKAFEKFAQKFADVFTKKHQKQLEVMHGQREAIATFKELRDEKLKEINVCKDVMKIKKEINVKQISTTQQAQKKRESINSIKRSESSTGTSEKDVAKLTIKRQGMRDRFAKAQRASSSPTASPRPTTKSARSFIQENPSSQKRSSTQENPSTQIGQSTQGSQSRFISRRK